MAAKNVFCVFQSLWFSGQRDFLYSIKFHCQLLFLGPVVVFIHLDAKQARSCRGSEDCKSYAYIFSFRIKYFWRCALSVVCGVLQQNRSWWSEDFLEVRTQMRGIICTSHQVMMLQSLLYSLVHSVIQFAPNVIHVWVVTFLSKNNMKHLF